MEVENEEKVNMYEEVKSMPFIEELIGDDAGLIAKIKDTDYYFSWAPHDKAPVWDEGGGMEGAGEIVEFQDVFDTAPEHIREQLVYHLELFTPRDNN